VARSSRALEERMGTAGDDLDQVIERFGEVQARYQELGGYDIEARAHTILAGLGLSQEQVGKRSWASSRAAGRCASRSRASCCCGRTRLLLDEPTNYLDIESIIWLEEFPARLSGRG